MSQTPPIASAVLIEHTVCKVKYVKDSGDESVRYIVPFHIPSHLVKAFDVTDVVEEQRQHVAVLRKEYSEYIDQLLSTAFTFEDWASHAHHVIPSLKYRSFKTAGLSSVE